MTEFDSGQNGADNMRWDQSNNVNEDMEDEDLENNSAKLFERSRIRALAGKLFKNVFDNSFKVKSL